MITRFCVFVALLSSSIVMAQNGAVVNLSSPEISGKKVQVLSMPDPITGREEILAEEVVPVSGSNQFLIPCNNDVIAITIKSGDNFSDLYISDLDTAYLQFDASKFTWQLERCKCLPVNKSINTINASVNAFFDQAYSKPGMPLPAKRTRFFTDSLRKSVNDSNNTYVANYLLFKTVDAELSANALSRRQAIVKFVNPKPILLNNPAWVDVFSNLFDGNMRRQLNSRGGDSLKLLLTAGSSLKMLLSKLNKDTLISNPELLKLILLKGIYELGHERDFSKKQFTETLTQLSADSNYASVRNHALQILKAWTVFEKGAKVPDFSYKPFPELITKQFSELKGKPVYLVYFPSFSQAFQKELLMLKALNERYKSQLSMLVIVNSSDNAGLSAALNKINPRLEVASYGDCSKQISQLIENQRLQSYYLIDKNNCFWQAPAEGPETGVEAAFLGLIKTE